MKWSTVRDTEKDSGRVRVIRRSSQRDKAETCGETRMEEILRVRVQKEGSPGTERVKEIPSSDKG